MRSAADFQDEALVALKAAGFNGVLVNGGSGIGPDMLLPEALVKTKAIPDLIPLTTEAYQREIQRRCEALRKHDLRPWLMFWGVPGPDQSTPSAAYDSNRFFDRRTKLEMTAMLRRTPDIFGFRNPAKMSWRGSRPLCVSHPVVQDFYRELGEELPRLYPDLGGVVFFPGDGDAELCDETCPRCQATGLTSWQSMAAHVTRLFPGLQKAGVPFHFCLWNHDSPRGPQTIREILDGLPNGMDVCMSFSDGLQRPAAAGGMKFNQPWVNAAQAGELFLDTLELARTQDRRMLVFAELAQTEVWDPVCHNLPQAIKIRELLQNTSDLDNIAGLCDFWGHRAPFISHANFAVMGAWFKDPALDAESHYQQAAAAHYSVPEALTAEAIACWKQFDTVVDEWFLKAWAQRFSFCIGRPSARGRLYHPLIPTCLRGKSKVWEMQQITKDRKGAQEFLSTQEKSRRQFLEVAGKFAALAETLNRQGYSTGSLIAAREAAHIELAAELLVSTARFVLAVYLFEGGEWEDLKALIRDEIGAREQQLLISGRCGFGGGVDPIFVSEDIQNMRLFLSDDAWPEVPDELFHLTPTPYSV